MRLQNCSVYTLNFNKFLCLLILLALFVNIIFIYAIYPNEGQRITRALRERVFGSIVRQEVAFFDQNKTGELINRLSTDTSLVSQCVTMNISDGLRSLIMVCAGVSMMVRLYFVGAY